MAIAWDSTAWVTLTAYSVGQRVVNGGNVYQCSAAGSSGAAPGPTGTSLTTPIVDGTVTWYYLGAFTGAVVDIAPELSGFVGAATALQLAEEIVNNPTLWGPLFDDARRYVAAHIGQFARLRGKGMITAEAVGPLSRSYTSLTGPLTWDLTAAGRMYRSLVRMTSAPLGSVP